MRKRTVKLWRLNDDGRKIAAGTIEAADPRELVMKWSSIPGDGRAWRLFCHLSRIICGTRGSPGERRRRPGSIGHGQASC